MELQFFFLSFMQYILVINTIDLAQSELSHIVIYRESYVVPLEAAIFLHGLYFLSLLPLLCLLGGK